MLGFRPAVRRVPTALLSLPTIFALSIAILLSGCGGSSGNSTPTPTPSTANEWTWMSGSSVANASGIYGTQGVSAATNAPGARTTAVSWIDSSGNFWLFGGMTATGDGLNDLWEFIPTSKNWTWMSGSSAGNSPGVYGTRGVAAPSNVPGGRYSAVSWTDSSGNLWLFGGLGFDSAGELSAFLNDLWEFNPTTKEWTWASGSNTPGAIVQGVYGTQGTASASNVPGARSSAVSWIDSSGNLWLFGGFGAGSNPLVAATGWFNDLWEFSPTTKEWTWMSGSSAQNAVGVYGTLGVAAPNTTPGAREGAVSWTDRSGNLWLFGGEAFNSAGAYPQRLNDLWEFNTTSEEWTWISGSSGGNSPGVYGTQGVAAANTVPGGRENSVSWIDSTGNLWLFGGEGFDSTEALGDLNDLWEFSPTTKEWTWISGSSTGNASGVFGTQGVTAASNVPGAREGAVSWIDSTGNLWLFGGDLYNGQGELNDLWRFQP
jgi:N-acetylneuraminic acid mutarotase